MGLQVQSHLGMTGRSQGAAVASRNFIIVLYSCYVQNIKKLNKVLYRTKYIIPVRLIFQT